MIGELKLTAIKSRLVSVGVQAEFVGEGFLRVICSAIGSSPEGLSGSVSEVYYIVRREIYNLRALVTA